MTKIEQECRWAWIHAAFYEALKDMLVHAATQYDRKQEGKHGYNRYTLAQYLLRIDEVVQETKAGKTIRQAGKTIRQALCDWFNDRLLNHLLKAIGEKP